MEDGPDLEVDVQAASIIDILPARITHRNMGLFTGTLSRPEITSQTEQLFDDIRNDDPDSLTQHLSSLPNACDHVHGIDYRSGPPKTAFSLAIPRGRKEIIQILLEYGNPLTLFTADENDVSFIIALRSILHTDGDGEDIFFLLIRAGLTLENASESKIGRSLWFWAVRRGYISVVKAFLDLGFPINICYAQVDISFFHDELYLTYYINNPLLPDTDASWIAIYNGYVELVKHLLHRGATLKIRKQG